MKSGVDVNALEDLWAEGHKLPTPEAMLLDDILTTAFHHDKICQKLEHGLAVMLASKPADYRAIDVAGYIRMATIDLCIQLHDAARRRMASLGFFAQEIIDGNAIADLRCERLDEFMRPIFDESGIGERYETRSTYEVYRYPGL